MLREFEELIDNNHAKNLKQRSQLSHLPKLNSHSAFSAFFQCVSPQWHRAATQAWNQGSSLLGGHNTVQWMQVNQSDKAGITCSLWRPNYSPGPAKRRSFWARRVIHRMKPMRDERKLHHMHSNMHLLQNQSDCSSIPATCFEERRIHKQQTEIII